MKTGYPWPYRVSDLLRGRDRCARLLVAAAVLLLLLTATGYHLGARQKQAGNSGREDRKRGATLQSLKARNASLKEKLRGLAPPGVHVVIDTGQNRLYLKRGGRTIHEAVTSGGSGGILKDPSGGRQWVFDTPRGEYRVETKQLSPLWIKPDWAFIEAGEAIPADPAKRVEAGALGNYAIGFGKGFYIHGTLYTRLLGRNVTHGCIRLNDRDLEVLFGAVDVGTRIYIF